MSVHGTGVVAIPPEPPRLAPPPLTIPPPTPPLAIAPATLAPPELEPLPAVTALEPPPACVGPIVPVPATGPGVPVVPAFANVSPGASVLHAPADKALSTHADPMDSNRLMFTRLA